MAAAEAQCWVEWEGRFQQQQKREWLGKAGIPLGRAFVEVVCASAMHAKLWAFMSRFGQMRYASTKSGRQELGDSSSDAAFNVRGEEGY